MLITQMVSPDVPVFGFLYPIGMVIVGHDGGCEGGLLDRGGGVRTASPTGSTPEWLEYAGTVGA